MLTRIEAILFGILGGAIVLTLGLMMGNDQRNLAGVDGAPGIAGPAGEAGPAGTVGPVGPAGADGAAGPAGSAGPAGPQGEPGADGLEGPAGVPGAPGAPGAPGVPGPQGEAGPQGATGAGDLGAGAVILVRQLTACPPGWTAGGEVRLLTSPAYAMTPDQTQSNSGVFTSETKDWANVNFFLCTRIAQ
jgi:Collagen triple helix repeat (20 copies)